METDCSFFFEIHAPEGLDGIEQYIEESGLNLYIYKSGYNNKNILKSRSAGIIELGMDTSTTEKMHGSGYIKSDFETAKHIINKLHNIFKQAGYSHEIGVDDENGENTIWLKHEGS